MDLAISIFSLGTTFTFSIFCVAQKAFEWLKASQFEQLFSIKFVIQRLQNTNNSIKYTWEKELFVVDLNVSFHSYEVSGTKTYKMPKFCQKRLRMLQKLYKDTSNLKHWREYNIVIIILLLFFLVSKWLHTYKWFKIIKRDYFK